MNKWIGYFGTGAVILFAVFLSTVFLARNGHGNPVVAGTQISVSDDAVGTRGTVSPRATEEVAKSRIPMSPHTSVAIVGTRGTVSPRPTEEVAKSRIPMSPHASVAAVGTRRAVSPRATEDVAESLNANKPSPQSLDPKSKFQNPPSPPSNPSAGNIPADHPEIIQKMQKLQMPFIANEGQVDEIVAFYAKTFGGTVFVTKNGEIVYSLPSGRDVPAGASQALCRDTACRVPTSPIQYLAYVIHSSKGDVLGRMPEKRASRIMDYVSWFGGCAPDDRLVGLRMSDSTKGWDTVPRVPTVNVWDDTASRVPTTATRRDTACRVPPVNVWDDTANRVPTTAARRDTACRVPAVALKEEFIGAKVSGITGEGESVTKVSYFKGNDPSKWKSNISTYQLVNLGEIYEGVELKLKAHGNNVEKLLYVKPGADPGQIKIRLSGMQPQESSFGKGDDRTDVTVGRGTDAPAGTSLQGVKPGADTEQMKICLSGMNDCGMRSAECGIEVPKSEFQNPKLQINNAGQLEAETALGTVAFTRPIAYQEIDGKRVEVAVEYKLYTTTQIIHRKGAKGAEERSEKHISHKDTKNTKEGIPGGMDCRDALAGRLYVCPCNEALKYENNVPCNFDGFDGFASLNPSYPSQNPTSAIPNPKSTTSDSPNPKSVIQNLKSEYSFTVASYDKTKDLIIDPLLASTFLGGSGVDGGFGTSLTLDTSGNVYVTGGTRSSDFPTTNGAYDTSYYGGDVFVSKLNSGLTSLLASTYLGGASWDYGNALALDTNGNVYVAGWTESTNFPTTSGAYDTSWNGSYSDVFVSKLDSGLTSLLASTFLGGSGNDYGNSLTLDTSGNVYVTGCTSSADFPMTSGAYDTSYNGYYDDDVFVSKLDGGLTSLIASTYLGGSGWKGDNGTSLAIDTSGNVYVMGDTGSTNFPTTSGAYDTSYNGSYYDVFVSKLNSGLMSMLASTFLGGSDYEWGFSLALDTNGNVYVNLPIRQTFRRRAGHMTSLMVVLMSLSRS